MEDGGGEEDSFSVSSRSFRRSGRSRDDAGHPYGQPTLPDMSMY
jgi:hypothetical protein